MSSPISLAELDSWEGLSRSQIARATGCASVHIFDDVASTMDIAHELASAGVASGALVVAERQSAGRGREGRRWEAAHRGIWLTLLSRNPDAEAASVLALRAGIAIRHALQPFSDAGLRIKWPNDIVTQEGKVAGILVEARWRDTAVQWIATGVGINVDAPDAVPGACGLRGGVSRAEVLAGVVAGLRRACTAGGAMREDEITEYMAWDALRGRRISAPLAGVVVGISHDGELVVSTAGGVAAVRSGSVMLEEGA